MPPADEETTKHLLTKRRLEDVASKTYDAVVIGSGISGLTTAALLARTNDWKVLVLEQHFTVGGCSHTFEKHGLEYDVGVHYVGGHVWERASALRSVFDYATEERLKWSKLDDVYDIAVVEGKRYPIRSTRAAFVEDLTRWFPDAEDVVSVAKYFKRIDEAAATFQGFVTHQITHAYTPGFVDRFVTRGWLTNDFRKHASKTVAQVLDECGVDNGTLRTVLTYLYGDYGPEPSKASFVEHAVVVTHYQDGSAYPVGGSSQIAKSLIPTVVSRGGDVLARAPVHEIVVDGSKRVVGVRVGKEPGQLIKCSRVVSAIGAANSLKLLSHADDSSILKQRLKRLDALPDSPAHMMVFVELEGSKEDLDLPTSNMWILPNENVTKAADDYFRQQSTVVPTSFFSFPSAKDPDWSKRFPTRSVAEIVVETKYEWFKEFESEKSGRRSHVYEEEKKMFGDRLITMLVDAFPQLKGRIVSTDVGTPLSSQHFLASKHGVSYGVAAVPERFDDGNWLMAKADDVEGLVFTGQDTLSCGVMGAVMSSVVAASNLSFKSLRVALGLMRGRSSTSSTTVDDDEALLEDDLEFEGD